MVRGGGSARRADARDRASTRRDVFSGRARPGRRRGAHLRVGGVAYTAKEGAVIALHVDGGALDLGGGPISNGAVVALAADGAFVWQAAVPGVPTTLAVASDRGGVVGARTGDEFQRPEPVAVARFTRDGSVVWSTEHPLPDRVDVLPDGTVVASGPYIGGFTYGDATTADWPGPGLLGFVTWTDADGRPRHVVSRRGTGPVAAAPDASLALLEVGGATEDYGARWYGCGQDLVRWDPSGREKARSPVATCIRTSSFTNNGDVWWTGIAFGPDGSLWLQGDAKQIFLLGARQLTPQARDVFVLRFSR